jgi:hypothetical protein
MKTDRHDQSGGSLVGQAQQDTQLDISRPAEPPALPKGNTGNAGLSFRVLMRRGNTLFDVTEQICLGLRVTEVKVIYDEATSRLEQVTASSTDYRVELTDNPFGLRRQIAYANAEDYPTNVAYVALKPDFQPEC